MVQIVGKNKEYSFNVDGTTFFGFNWWVTFADSRVEGVMSERLFVNKNLENYQELSSLPVGTCIDYAYNRYGKPDMRTVKVVKS